MKTTNIGDFFSLILQVMENELSIVFKGLEISNEEIKSIQDTFTKVTFKKGDIVIRNNEDVKHQYYVLSGCLRAFFVDEKGKEHTVQFAVNDWWISDYIGYFSETKSVLTIECIEEAVLLRVSKKNIEETYNQIPK